MLMTPMTPKVMARPMAASSSTEPSDRPYQKFCATLPDGEVAVDGGDGLGDGALDGGRLVGRHAGQQAARVLVAAVADGDDGRHLVGLAGVGLGEDDGGARLLQRLLHARVALLGERRIERRQRVGVLAT